MVKRLVVLVVVLVFLGGGSALVSIAGSDSTDDLPKLPLASAGSARTTAEASDAAATGAAADMRLSAPVNPLGIEVQGQLPELGGTAAAYEIRGGDGVTDAAALAKAFGLDIEGGETRSKGDFMVISGTAGQATLQNGGMRTWSVFRNSESANCSTSSDGTTRSAGSGSAATRPAIACAEPACPADQPCRTLAKCDMPEAQPAPTRPADMPTKEAAEQAARAALGKIGADVSGATVNTTDALSAWAVTFTPSVEGHPVPALATHVTIGPRGVVQSASGHFGRPVKLGDYPLAGTAKGIERLKAGRILGGAYYAVDQAVASRAEATTSAAAATTQAAPAVDCKSPADGREPADLRCGVQPMPAPVPQPEPRKAVVTGAKLDLGMVMDANGRGLLVPAYAFTFQTGGATLVPAVIDDLLEEPVAGTTNTAVDMPAREVHPQPAAKDTPARP